MTLKDPDQLIKELNPEDEDTGDDISPVLSFTVDVKDDFGQRWKGDFVYKVPTLGEQIQIGRLKAEYLPNGAAADPNALGLVEIVCYLSVTLRKKPDWWKPFELYDSTPLMAVWKEVMAHEAKFLRSRAAARPVDQVAEQREEANTREHRDDGDDGVGRKVQPPTERRATTLSNTERSS